MLRAERHRYILNKLQNDQKVLSATLCTDLRVSEDTIRRDLKELADAGQLRKVHGGALPRSPIPHRHREREQYAQANKLIIAQKAVSLITSGQVIIMDGGTTTLQLARTLPPDLQITVFTNSIPLAATLAEHPHAEVIVAGGRLYKNSQVTLGAETVEAFRHIRADLCLLGVCSLHHEIGLTVRNWEEAQVKREMIASAARVVALASAEKIGTAEAYVVGNLTAVHTLITDDTATEATLQPYRSQGLEVM